MDQRDSQRGANALGTRAEWVLGIAFLAIAWATAHARGADWPTYMHDCARSGVTAEALPTSLSEVWVYRAAFRPNPAWGDPARRGDNGPLRNKVAFDKAIHVAAVGDAVYFGSSVDDCVYCLNADNGKERWVFFTEGPVRLAPTVADGRVYVGSDDGCVYCLGAADGEVLWKCRPAPRDLRVPGNGRIISLHPIRTGVIVRDGHAYFGAGVFPLETVYVCAVEATTGREVWKTALQEIFVQGYLLASAKYLYVVAGRDCPTVFGRLTGEHLPKLDGVGGSYALLAGDMLVNGPGPYGNLTVHVSDQIDRLAQFDGNHLIVTTAVSYLYTNQKLKALSRAGFAQRFAQRAALVERRSALGDQLASLETGGETEAAEHLRAQWEETSRKIDETAKGFAKPPRVLWEVDCDCPYALILAGGRLFAGGDGKVAAFDVQNGEPGWNAGAAGKAYGLAAANGRFYVSTDAGTIHCFAAPEAR